MQKLTLSVDEQVIARAKRYAKARSTSVSRLVESMLDMVALPTGGPGDVPPVLAKLRGSMKRGSEPEYHRYLERNVPVKRILLDVNIVLDVLLDRRPFAAVSSAVWSAVENGDAEGLLSAHALTTIHYLNARAVGSRMARETTEALLTVFEVAPVDERVLRTAAALGWPDFEDAVTMAAARLAKCDAVVTRNPNDFKGSAIRVLNAPEAAAWLGVHRDDRNS